MVRVLTIDATAAATTNNASIEVSGQANADDCSNAIAIVATKGAGNSTRASVNVAPFPVAVQELTGPERKSGPKG